MTDAHDLEATLIQSPTLEKVLLHLGRRELIEKFEAGAGMTVREALLRRAEPLGRLRWLSDQHGWELLFRKSKQGDRFVYIPYGEFFDELTWELSVGKMIAKAKDFSQRPGLDARMVEDLLGSGEPVDPWQICNGHDLCGILAIGLCRVLGNRRSSEKLSGDDIQDALILAHEWEHLEATAMCGGLRAWEERGSFVILERLARGGGGGGGR